MGTGQYLQNQAYRNAVSPNMTGEWTGVPEAAEQGAALFGGTHLLHELPGVIGEARTTEQPQPAVQTQTEAKTPTGQPQEATEAVPSQPSRQLLEPDYMTEPTVPAEPKAQVTTNQEPKTWQQFPGARYDENGALYMPGEHPNQETSNSQLVGNEKIGKSVLVIDGGTYTGQTHFQAFEQYQHSHPDADYSQLLKSGGIQFDGFMTNRGRMVDANEAASIARASRQMANPKEPSLHSENIIESPNQEILPSHTGDEPWVSAVANKYTEQRVASREIGEIAPGQGYATADLVKAGERMKPEEVTQHVSDLMHNTGDPIAQAAAVRAEEARLSQVSNNTSRIAEANPGDRQAQINSENAFKDLTDFHNGPMAKLKSNWSAQGMTMQGEVPIDLTTYNGLRQSWLNDVGKPPPSGAEPVLRRTAAKVRDAVDAENGAMDRLGQRIDGTKATRSAEEVRNSILERMGELPCVTL